MEVQTLANAVANEAKPAKMPILMQEYHDASRKAIGLFREGIYADAINGVAIKDSPRQILFHLRQNEMEVKNTRVNPANPQDPYFLSRKINSLSDIAEERLDALQQLLMEPNTSARPQLANGYLEFGISNPQFIYPIGTPNYQSIIDKAMANNAPIKVQFIKSLINAIENAKYIKNKKGLKDSNEAIDLAIKCTRNYGHYDEALVEKPAGATGAIANDYMNRTGDSLIKRLEEIKQQGIEQYNRLEAQQNPEKEGRGAMQSTPQADEKRLAAVGSLEELRKKAGLNPQGEWDVVAQSDAARSQKPGNTPAKKGRHTA